MDIFTDYANWLMENSDLILLLKERDSNAIKRFKHIFLVVEHLYNIKVDKTKELEGFEEEFFQAGFNYLFDRMEIITLLYKNTFKNDINLLEEFSKDINLVLYAYDFERDLENYENVESEIAKFQDLQNKYLSQIEKHEHICDAEFVLLDELSSSVFEALNISYFGINEIFYEIALEYNIIDEDYEEIIFN